MLPANTPGPRKDPFRQQHYQEYPKFPVYRIEVTGRFLTYGTKVSATSI